ncbi:MAG TPA: hypothetical protein VMX94_05620 [Armatimonadota bacterium]|nr:hypothetical protein [Armatimonadota bacterium]
MRLDENQRVQFIILCCLIAVVAAVGIYRVVGKSTRAGRSAVRQSQVQQEASASSRAGEAAQVDSRPLRPVGGELKARDPFTPQVGPKVASSQSSSRATSSLGPIVGSGPLPPIVGMAPLTMEAIKVNNLSPPAEQPSSQLRLTGVIEGDTKVAIIRGGENTRYIVREGQMIDGKYMVESISRVGVRLRYNNKSLILRLGVNTTT